MSWFKNRMVAAGEIATAKLTVTPVLPQLTAAAESSNAIAVSVQLVDPDGNSVARSVRLLCQVRKSTGIVATSSEFRLSETGAGAEVSTTANPVLVVTTSASGTATINVLDQSGAYTDNAYLEVIPLNTFGMPAQITLDFN